jgi:hypothetical protein
VVPQAGAQAEPMKTGDDDSASLVSSFFLILLNLNLYLTSTSTGIVILSTEAS